MHSVQTALETLRALAGTPTVTRLAEAFAAQGHELALVGGPVRDAFLGHGVHDLDFTTSARPDDIVRIVAPIAEAHWDIGRAFGTIGARVAGETVEITTYRSDSYDGVSRKPEVEFGDSLEGDLVRRDFTVNAMALRLPEVVLVDPSGGVEDLLAGRLRTPSPADLSFGDDPLRMLRGARFTSQLGFRTTDEVEWAMAELAGRIDDVSAERVQEELRKLLATASPRAGLELLVDTGLAGRFLPELPALRLEQDEHHHHKDVYTHSLTVLEQAIALEESRHPGAAPDVVLRLAALLHDIGKPATRRLEPAGAVSFHHHDLVGSKLAIKRMRALKFDNQTTKDVARLIELHLRFFGYTDGAWTDSAVRRYVTDAGPLLERLHILTRADVTTRNRRKADRLAHAYDDLEARIAELAEKEELASKRPDLDGTRIMEILGLAPGPAVGQAYRFLLELRLEEGPLGEEVATQRLREWWASR
ncbi:MULTISPECIES: CCA tRNA nucleotidyltransferase [unclassified Rathayibacter]|jgi:poly(A) polymerase|uniref:CCA tRNA nucleotidyltransferase n=1 Tax=unclassified Rathayibacter TaxID=2609250 RepID=UPI000CE8BFA7|nr:MULTISPECIES: CCA tRNA nucleotidyltransferase [unclassified Rathayibacter]PPF49869.1 CCA tRNA nucleotidyltransferase [Rathayibacter sp. AY1A1]PPG85087.1 CCA tRNA nucleotidyltransferase [Rathayibacter sp. AY1H2]PPH03163.1 CCA tRNA nucleotidyltransferase [Rathayibacter sp. AY1G9]PPH33499.1 CCA tRNA nucleotidyltransferase [Rathayibacter sp. AY1C3]PPI31929.1 CCA tRNA nucleotidyltransferase [Rathayibacter sp. AY1B4]